MCPSHPHVEYLLCCPTGIPRLTAGISWDSKRSLLLLALRQAGSKAVMQGALKASEPVVLGGENTGGAAPGGRACTLKVLVRELDSCEEHPLQVGGDGGLYVRFCTNRALQ